jgi:hypothetical protein
MLSKSRDNVLIAQFLRFGQASRTFFLHYVQLGAACACHVSIHSIVHLHFVVHVIANFTLSVNQGGILEEYIINIHMMFNKNS